MFGAVALGFITGTPQIASIVTASGWTTIMDVRTSPLYVPLPSGGYHLALDHPVIPYRASASTLPYIILTLGQSNPFIQRPYVWSPNVRAKIWNNGRATDTSVGTAYTAISPDLMNVAVYRAHLIAEANPNRDVRVIILASGSLDIGHFDDGNALFWSATTTASDPGGGNMRANNADLALATAFYCSENDAAASSLVSAYGLIQNGHKIQVRDNSTPTSAWFFTATGPAVDNGTWWTIPVAYVSGSGALSGGVRFITQPDYQMAMDAVVPAALAAAGVSKIDEVCWWQIESNTRYSVEARYKAQFESVVTKIKAKAWADDDVKFIMFSGANTALTGDAWSDKGPEWISELAAVDPVNRKYVDLTTIPAAQWTEKVHQTAQGYMSSAQKSFDVYAPEIDGATMFLAGAGRTYRYHVKNNDFSAASISMTPVSHLRDNNNTGVQFDYDHRVWPGFAVYADGSDLYSIAHHEWYPYTVTVDGIPGRNATLGHKWVTSPLWCKFSDNGMSFETKPYTSYATSGIKNPERLYLTTEDWFLQSYDTLYGYQHPGGYVYPPDIGQTSDPYYYAVLDTNHLAGPGDTLLTVGVTLIRWSDKNDPTTTQFLVNGVWTNRDMAGYQGNNAPAAQQPDVMFPLHALDPYAGGARTDGMGKCLKWHWPTQQWLMFGFDGRRIPSTCFMRSKTLANPQFEQNGVTAFSYAGGGVNADYGGNSYWTVIDPAATDQNFTAIGNSPILIRTNDYVTVEKQTLDIRVV